MMSIAVAVHTHVGCHVLLPLYVLYNKNLSACLPLSFSLL